MPGPNKTVRHKEQLQNETEQFICVFRSSFLCMSMPYICSKSHGIIAYYKDLRAHEWLVIRRAVNGMSIICLMQQEHLHFFPVSVSAWVVSAYSLQVLHTHYHTHTYKLHLQLLTQRWEGTSVLECTVLNYCLRMCHIFYDLILGAYCFPWVSFSAGARDGPHTRHPRQAHSLADPNSQLVCFCVRPKQKWIRFVS